VASIAVATTRAASANELSRNACMIPSRAILLRVRTDDESISTGKSAKSYSVLLDLDLDLDLDLGLGIGIGLN
jgi:hypothetical protein